LENRRAEQVLSGKGLAPVGGGGYKERVRRVNMVEYYALVYESGKMRPAETVLRTGEEGKKESDGGGIQL
jgi:chromosome condensin MukBEF MukE localization factor